MSGLARDLEAAEVSSIMNALRAAASRWNEWADNLALPDIAAQTFRDQASEATAFADLLGEAAVVTVTKAADVGVYGEPPVGYRIMDNAKNGPGFPSGFYVMRPHRGSLGPEPTGQLYKSHADAVKAAHADADAWQATKQVTLTDSVRT